MGCVENLMSVHGEFLQLKNSEKGERGSGGEGGVVKILKNLPT